MTQKKASPQTQEELRIAKENLARELKEKNLTGSNERQGVFLSACKNRKGEIHMLKIETVYCII